MNHQRNALTRTRLAAAFAAATALALTTTASAAPISITDGNLTYSEDFDSLGTETTYVNGTTVPGWHVTDTSLTVTNGTTGGGMHNFGSSSLDTDRAIGAKTDQWHGWGGEFTNNTSAAIESVDVSYFGETWRILGGQPASEIQVFYKVGGSFDLASSTGTATPTGWTNAGSSLTYTGATGSSTVNNQGDSKRALVSGTINVNVDPGQTLWIAFRTNPVANHNLAADDFSATFNLVPEPASLALFGLGALGMLPRRRRRV